MGHHRLPGNHCCDVADLRALVRHDRAQAGMARRVGSLYSRLGRLWRGDLALPQGLRETFPPSASAERGQRVHSQLRSKRHLATMKPIENVSLPPLVASMMVIAA